MKRILTVAVIAAAALSLTLVACGGGSDSGGGGGTGGLNAAKSVTGTALSANGDPVPGTTVYLPGTTVTADVSKKFMPTRSFDKVVTAGDGTECEDPPAADQALVSCCAGANGTFTCDTSGVTTNPTQIVFVRGTLRMVQALNCTADPCALGSEVTKFGSGTTTWPRVAVVTGSWDRMEDVLAKLADDNTSDATNGDYGRVDSTTGWFVYGSESGTNLTIINGTSQATPSEGTTVPYDDWITYLNGTKSLVTGGVPVFDVIFLNCGDYGQNTIDYKATLQAYVDAGGRIYVTDRAYDNIEQAFPQFMRYDGDPDDATVPGALAAAKVGTGGLTVNAAISDASMRTWLSSRPVNGNAAGTAPGNPTTDCSGVTGYTSVASALNADGTIPIGDFLGGWALMTSAHTGQSPTIWISSGAGNVFDGLDNRPLTASMNIGTNGRIVYSSYHTADTCPTLTFWPQERVLQYLMFGAF
ncbi:MAG: hypothetical protein WC956_08865 [bacterium]